MKPNFEFHLTSKKTTTCTVGGSILPPESNAEEIDNQNLKYLKYLGNYRQRHPERILGPVNLVTQLRMWSW